MYYKEILAQLFKLKRKRGIEFGLFKKKKKSNASFRKTWIPFCQVCFYLFQRNLSIRPRAIGLTMSS